MKKSQKLARGTDLRNDQVIVFRSNGRLSGKIPIKYPAGVFWENIQFRRGRGKGQ